MAGVRAVLAGFRALPTDGGAHVAPGWQPCAPGGGLLVGDRTLLPIRIGGDRTLLPDGGALMFGDRALLADGGAARYGRIVVEYDAIRSGACVLFSGINQTHQSIVCCLWTYMHACPTIGYDVMMMMM